MLRAIVFALLFLSTPVLAQETIGTVTTTTDFETTVTPIRIPPQIPDTVYITVRDTVWITRTVTILIEPGPADTTITVSTDTTVTDPGNPPGIPPGSTDIGAAIDSASVLTAQGIDALVQVAPGTYDLPLLIDHPGPGTITVQGPAVLTGFFPANGTCAADQWSIDWPDPFPAECPNAGCDPSNGRTPDANGLRHEVIRVDGVLVDQYGTGPMQYHRNATTVFVQAPCDAFVERAFASIGVEVRGGDVVLRNLTVEGVESQPSDASQAVFVEAENVRLENVTVRHNNWSGVGVHNSVNVEIVNSDFHQNGHDGLTGHMIATMDVVDSKVNNNGWRQCGIGGLTGWSIGNKILRADSLTITGSEFDNNCARNLWIDYGVENVVIDGNVFSNSQNADGIWVEASRNVSVTANDFVGNFNRGLSITFTNDLSVVGNLFEGNGTAIANMHSRDCNGADAPTPCVGRTVGWRDWELFRQTGQRVDIERTHDNNWQDWEIRGNTFRPATPTQYNIWWGSTTNEIMSDFEPFHAGSVYADNEYCHPEDRGLGWQGRGHFVSVATFTPWVEAVTGNADNSTGCVAPPAPPSGAPAVAMPTTTGGWESPPIQ